MLLCAQANHFVKSDYLRGQPPCGSCPWHLRAVTELVHAPSVIFRPAPTRDCLSLASGVQFFPWEPCITPGIDGAGMCPATYFTTCLPSFPVFSRLVVWREWAGPYGNALALRVSGMAHHRLFPPRMWLEVCQRKARFIVQESGLTRLRLEGRRPRTKVSGPTGSGLQ